MLALVNTVMKLRVPLEGEEYLGEISGSHGGEYEDGCLVRCCAV
jgi:hypothetical protein